MLIAEVPNLNLLYEGETGIAVCHTWNGKHIIHSELYNDNPTLEELKVAKEVSIAIDEAFKQKGVKTLYTWAENDSQERYNKFLGYKTTGKTVNDTFTAKDYPRDVMEYSKELI